MKTAGEAATRMIEVLAGQSRWMRVSELATRTGLAVEEIWLGTAELFETCDDFQAEPDPFPIRLTADERRLAPVIGAEPRHLFRLGA